MVPLGLLFYIQGTVPFLGRVQGLKKDHAQLGVFESFPNDGRKEPYTLNPKP